MLETTTKDTKTKNEKKKSEVSIENGGANETNEANAVEKWW